MQRLHESGADELTNSGDRDADVATDTDEPDTPLSDQAGGEPLSRAKQLRDLGDSQ
jgi:hypothetical protein